MFKLKSYIYPRLPTEASGTESQGGSNKLRSLCVLSKDELHRIKETVKT